MRLIFNLFMIWSTLANAQEIAQYETFDAFENAVLDGTEELQVINFWATWCAPCVKELPYFEKLNGELGGNTEVVLVSIDFANQHEKRLVPFVEKRELDTRVVHLTDPKANDWIDRVDPSWSGAIPATLFRYKGKNLFLEKEFSSYEELQDVIQGFVGDINH